MPDIQTDFYHHNQAAAIDDGEDLDVMFASDVCAYITRTGEGATSTVEFYGSVDGVNYVAWPGAMWDTTTDELVIADQTTGTGEVWSFDVKALKKLRLKVAAVSGGTVTVVSNAKRM